MSPKNSHEITFNVTVVGIEHRRYDASRVLTEDSANIGTPFQVKGWNKKT